MTNEELNAYKSMIEPLRWQSRSVLRKRATWLKQQGGESWAIGEVVERACILMDAEDLLVRTSDCALCSP